MMTRACARPQQLRRGCRAASVIESPQWSRSAHCLPGRFDRHSPDCDHHIDPGNGHEPLGFRFGERVARQLALDDTKILAQAAILAQAPPHLHRPVTVVPTARLVLSAQINRHAGARRDEMSVQD